MAVSVIPGAGVFEEHIINNPLKRIISGFHPVTRTYEHGNHHKLLTIHRIN